MTLEILIKIYIFSNISWNPYNKTMLASSDYDGKRNNSTEKVKFEEEKVTNKLRQIQGWSSCGIRQRRSARAPLTSTSDGAGPFRLTMMKKNSWSKGLNFPVFSAGPNL